MKKSNKSSEEAEDRLSELPDSMIFEIFGLLPMKDVVRTTILSKRWNNLWTTTPYLNFIRHHDSVSWRHHSSEFVSRALTLWKGFKILKSKFRNKSLLTKSVFSDIDLWVRWATENGIEELYLELFSRSNDEAYRVPHSLYSCSSLKVLSLGDCNFENHGDVQWNQLKSLTIGGFSIDQNLINKVISGSPRLEVFVLDILNWDENLSIQSTSLKKLSIQRHVYGDPSAAALRIWSPNLETLDIIGEPYGKFSLVNVSSLTHLTLDFHYYDEGVYFEDILGQIFPSIPHVEKLTLSKRCTKVLGDMKGKYLLSPKSNCKILSMNKSEVEYDKIVDILHIFPKLETLVLESDYFPLKFKNHVTSFLQVERNLPKSFLLQLRTVEITFIEDEDFIFPFIELLLKYASKLQKMVIRVQDIKPPTMPWFLAQKLLRMPRASPTAELIFLPDY